MNLKASDTPYVLLGLAILAVVTWFSIWQTIRLCRSAQATASNLRRVIESIARALNMQLDDGSGPSKDLPSRLPTMKGAGGEHATRAQPQVPDPIDSAARILTLLDDDTDLPSGLPRMKAVIREHATKVQPKVLDPRLPLALSFSISVAPRPGRRWVMSPAGTQPVLEDLPSLRAKRDKLTRLCPGQQRRILALFAPERAPLRVVGAHVVSASISVDLQRPDDIPESTPSTSSADSDDLRRIIDDLVSIAEALPSQPA
jgi:hypothetical protein